MASRVASETRLTSENLVDESLGCPGTTRAPHGAMSRELRLFLVVHVALIMLASLAA